MTEAFFRQAICEDPDSDVPRLAFADWLEANDNPNRAAWIRVSCEFDRIPYMGKGYDATSTLRMESFKRCCPVWWEYITNITQHNDRGIFRFQLGGTRSAAAVAPIERLRDTPWIGRALEEAWLQRIELLWDATKALDAIEKWRGDICRVPLFVETNISGNLGRVLALPQLEALSLSGKDLIEPAMKALGSCSNIRELSLSFRLADNAAIADAIDQVVSMTALRQLHLKSDARIDKGLRPNDVDLGRLSRLDGLKRLYLSDCPAVSEQGIQELQRKRPSLVVQRPIRFSPAANRGRKGTV
jgi:uncharacterized protein (TIGR02996 family)